MILNLNDLFSRSVGLTIDIWYLAKYMKYGDFYAWAIGLLHMILMDFMPNMGILLWSNPKNGRFHGTQWGHNKFEYQLVSGKHLSLKWFVDGWSYGSCKTKTMQNNLLNLPSGNLT